jgi:hypothetical protein
VTGAWSGDWKTDCGSPNCGAMSLLQTGNTVVGTYAGGDGTINGTVSGNHLSGTWSRNGTSGSIEFWMGGGEQFWIGGFDGYYRWCGSRPDVGYPTPCGVSTWNGTWTTNCPSACGTMILTQDVTTISGTYAGGTGTVTGVVTGTTVSGTWMRNGVSGNFEFEMVLNGDQFQGHFGAASQWCGHRNGAGYPNPCLK